MLGGDTRGIAALPAGGSFRQRGFDLSGAHQRQAQRLPPHASQQLQIMRDKQHAAFLMRLPLNGGCKPVHVGPVKAAGRFVQNEQGRALGQSAGNDQTLFFPAGKRLGMPPRELQQAEFFKQHARMVGILLPGQFQTGLHLLLHGAHVQLVVGILQHQAAVAHTLFCIARLVANEDFTVLLLVEARKNPGQSGFARSIVPDDGSDAAGQVKIDAFVEGLAALVRMGEVAGLYPSMTTGTAAMSREGFSRMNNQEIPSEQTLLAMSNTPTANTGPHARP